MAHIDTHCRSSFIPENRYNVDMLYLVIAVILLSAAVIILFIRNLLLRKGFDELTRDIKDQAKGETNVPISLTTSDKHARKAAEILNSEFSTLRKEKLRFEDGNKRISKAVTGISHDLRTPLTAINSYLDLLDEEKDEAKRQEYLSRIKNRTEVLTDLTEELFKYSSVSDKEEYMLFYTAPENIDIRKALEDCLLSFYQALSGKGIEPEITMPEEEVLVSCNKKSADRILENVINNAVKYAKSDLQVSLSKDGEIVFQNQAPDLSSVSVAKLFDRYYTVSDQSHATGLGLSIARELMEQNGGTINAEYEDGKLVITLKFQGIDGEM